MDNQKLQRLLQDEKFIEVMGGAKTNEEVQKVFKDNGLEISVDETKALIDNGKKALDDGFLDKIVGGGFGDGFKAGINPFSNPSKSVLEGMRSNMEKMTGEKISYDDMIKEMEKNEGPKALLDELRDTGSGDRAGKLALCGIVATAGIGLGVCATLLIQKLRKKK